VNGRDDRDRQLVPKPGRILRAGCDGAGLDFSNFAGMASAGNADEVSGGTKGLLGREAGAIATRAQDAAWLWHELPVPVIAAVHGACLGGGLQIAMGADIRFITPDARMSIMEIRWGLVPDMAGPQILRHHLRLDVIKELTYTGRIVSGSEAVELGLATHLSEDPHAAAMALATEIASKSPSAVRSGKRLLNDVAVVEREEGLRLEADLQAKLLGRPNQIEAVKSNLEKRPANFEDPS